MRLATSEHPFQSRNPGDLPPRLVRLGYDHPDEVVEDPMLDAGEKRTLLCSWASDASAVRDEPTLRWLLGTPGPVRLDDIRAALWRLDAGG